MNRLQELRKNKGDTQKTLAELLGVSEMTISRWEKEPELKIKYEYIQKLAEYFKVNMVICWVMIKLSKMKHWVAIKIWQDYYALTQI